MYGWDDDEIDSLFRDKLLNQHVPVTLALDKTQAAGRHERQILARWRADLIGNSVFIGRSSRGAISHDKMIVLDGQVTVVGSTNLSAGGETRQNNEMTVVWDAVFAAEARARVDMIADEMAMQMKASA